MCLAVHPYTPYFWKNVKNVEQVHDSTYVFKATADDKDVALIFAIKFYCFNIKDMNGLSFSNHIDSHTRVGP